MVLFWANPDRWRHFFFDDVMRQLDGRLWTKFDVVLVRGWWHFFGTPGSLIAGFCSVLASFFLLIAGQFQLVAGFNLIHNHMSHSYNKGLIITCLSVDLPEKLQCYMTNKQTYLTFYFTKKKRNYFSTFLLIFTVHAQKRWRWFKIIVCRKSKHN